MYEGEETRQLALNLGQVPVAPPKADCISRWEYDREMYKRRNAVGRLFRRPKGFRRVFSRFDKLGVAFSPSSTSRLLWMGYASVNAP